MVTAAFRPKVHHLLMIELAQIVSPTFTAL